MSIKYVGLDIETEGLDPTEHRITSVSFAETGLTHTTTTDYSVDNVQHQWAEDLAVADVIERLRKLHQHTVLTNSSVVICTWNGSAFDFPFLDTRLRKIMGNAGSLFSTWPWILDIADDRPPKYDPLPGHVGGYRVSFPFSNVYHVDLAFVLKDWCETNGVAWSLKSVLEAHDIPTYTRTGTNKLGSAAAAGLLTTPELAAYNISDAEGTRLLAMQHIDSIHPFIDPKRPQL